MVLLGRMLTGFGSARTINRRYIADYYSIEDRTSGMAVFVSASALGMAVGPGLAAALSAVAPAGSGTNSFWTIETAPGKSKHRISLLCTIFDTLQIRCVLNANIRLCHVCLLDYLCGPQCDVL